MTTPTEIRLKLSAAGFSPIPAEGKKPPMDKWQEKFNATDDEIRLWPKTWHYARNTGVLAKFTPGLDNDITDEDAAEAMEYLAREHFGHGKITLRIGLWPKRLIPLQTNEPFAKLRRVFRAPDGTEHKIEILGDGQQWIAFGEHPDTKMPYRWTHGEPGNDFAREDLPCVRLADVVQYLDAAETLLIDQHGFTLVTGLSEQNGGEPHGAGRRTASPVVAGRSRSSRHPQQ
jgi:putative DNA primase/helicase